MEQTAHSRQSRPTLWRVGARPAVGDGIAGSVLFPGFGDGGVLIQFTTVSSSFLGLGFLVGLIVVAAVIVFALRGRSGRAGRAGPAAYMGYGLSFVCISVGLVAGGIAVHSVSELVGPAPLTFDGIGPEFPPCSSTQSTATTDPAVGTGLVPCVNYGTSSAGQATFPIGTSTSDGGLFSASLVASGGGSDRNQYISDAVAAALFALVAGFAYRWIWRRTRQLHSGMVEDLVALDQFGANYGYLIAGLAAASLLLFVPLAADAVFRAVAPGIAQASGHADGLREFVTFLALSGAAAGLVVYHLRYARALTDAVMDTLNQKSEDNQGPEESE